MFVQNFQDRLEQLQPEVHQFHERAQQLERHLPPLASKKIDVQSTLILNRYTELGHFRDELLAYCAESKHREKTYSTCLNELTETTRHVQTALQTTQLKDGHGQLSSSKLHELDRVLRSKRHLIERLQANDFLFLHKRSEHLHGIISDYCQCHELIQTHLKQSPSGDDHASRMDIRCEKWNDYIRAIEQNLSVIQDNLRTNYYGLIEIEKNLASTLNDFQQRQDELMALVRRGQQGKDNPSMYAQLEQRWHFIMNTVVNKQRQVKDMIQLWLIYQKDVESRVSL